MSQETGKFELSLSFHELLFLFFVMIALFTALLIFGYRVGYTQHLNARRAQPRNVAPAQERPAVQIEPELRMENLAPSMPGSVWPVVDSEAAQLALQSLVADVHIVRSARPCSTVERSGYGPGWLVSQRMFGLLASMARVSSPDGRTWALRGGAGQLDAAHGREMADSGCRPVKYWRAVPSLAC